MVYKIFNFNHVSKDLTEDQITRFKEMYTHYHRLTKCYERMYKKSKYKDNIFMFLKVLLISGSTGGTVLGCITLNPLILGAMSGVGLLIAGYMRKANLSKAVDRNRFAFKNYRKVLNNLREFMRGVHFDQVQFDGKLMVIDDLVREMCSEIPDSVDKWYAQEYESSS